jgi:hypothetical protein
MSAVSSLLRHSFTMLQLFYEEEYDLLSPMNNFTNVEYTWKF